MPGTQITLRSIVLDCPDAWALAGFYSALLGWDRHGETEACGYPRILPKPLPWAPTPLPWPPRR